MKIKKEDLQNALEIVKPGLANKEFIQQATAFAFIEGTVVTFNDEISISHPVEGLEITGAVQAEKLYKFLSRVQAEEIELEINTNKIESDDGAKDITNEILIKASKANAGLILHSEIKLPLKEIGKKGKWKDLPDDFVDALQFTAPTTSRDMSNPIITCINIKDNGTFEASDNFRITHYHTEDLGVPTFLLPATTAIQLAKYNLTQIARGQGWVHFKTDKGTEISCRIFGGDFPKTSHLIEVEGSEITFPEGFQEVIDRAAVFAKRDLSLEEEIVISVDKKHMVVSATSESGWFEEEVPGKVENTNLKFAINPEFLSSILQKKYTATIDSNKLRFEGKNWVHVVALQAK